MSEKAHGKRSIWLRRRPHEPSEAREIECSVQRLREAVIGRRNDSLNRASIEERRGAANAAGGIGGDAKIGEAEPWPARDFLQKRLGRVQRRERLELRLLQAPIFHVEEMRAIDRAYAPTSLASLMTRMVCS